MVWWQTREEQHILGNVSLDPWSLHIYFYFSQISKKKTEEKHNWAVFGHKFQLEGFF